ncbi:hypothetical protein JCM3770_002826 [Rhodotorula araucariae]
MERAETHRSSPEILRPAATIRANNLDLTLDLSSEVAASFAPSFGPSKPRVKREPVKPAREQSMEQHPAEEELLPPASPTTAPTSLSRSVLFLTPESFPSDTAFFDACHDRLLSMYGAAAIPSKRKPTQVSTSNRPRDSAVVAATTSPPSIPPPVYPSPGETFPSVSDIFQAYVRALVTSLGNSCHWYTKGTTVARLRCNRGSCQLPKSRRCKFEVVLLCHEKTKLWTVDPVESIHVHNHGPDPRLVADPSWRPDIRSAEALQALSPQAKGTRLFQARQGKVPNHAKKRSALPVAFPAAKKRRVASPVPVARAPTAGRAASADVSPRRAPSPAPALAPPAPASEPSSPSSASDSGVELLLPFLHALHPSTAALARHLVTLGLSTAADLAALVLLSPPIFDLFLSDLRTQIDAANARAYAVGGARLTAVQLKLFEAKLRQARRELAP